MKNPLKNISYKHYFAVLFVVISLIASQAIHSVVTKAAASETKITSSDGASNDQFGVNVFIYNNYAVVGATGDDDNVSNSGSAYVFEKSVTTWSQIAKLTASDGLLNDAFGESISVNDDFIFIGSNRHTASVANEGTVYVFKKPVSGWNDMTETAKLTASDMQSGDGFGRSISSSNSTVVIGAYTNNEPTDDEGSAYVFERSGDTWNQTAKLTASGAAVDDQFGNSVSISGDNIAIGAPGYSGSSSGSAYVFVKPGTGWADATEDAKLTASDGATDDFFGRSISISGDNIIIGAHGDDDSGSSSGSAYVFVKPGTGWATTSAFDAKLTASDGISSTYFGYSVSILDSHVAIGSPGDNFPNQSSIYLFEQPGSGWSDMTETRKIIASDIANGDSTGYSINQFGDYIIVGAHGDDNIGSAYIHDRTNIHDVFTDTNFQQCVDIAVDGIDDDIIDVALAATLAGTLNCNSLGILNISGAQYLTSITDLWLTSNSVSDLTPVSTLSSLADLHLAENNISDLSPLSGMTNLKNLALDSNNFADSELTILNNLTSLVSLSLYGNNIASLNGGVNWAGLTSLTTLNLNSNNLESKDLDSIKGLTTLRSLHLNHNNITTLTDLSGLVNLTNLALNNNDISDLAAIGSGNATLTGFRDNNVINISSNNFTGVEETALTEIHDYLEATPNPAVVTHNINWENCSDGIDNDDDGDIDGADTYCFTTFYVDYDNGKTGTDCGDTAVTTDACNSIQELFNAGNTTFQTVIAGTNHIIVNVQGTNTGSGDTIGTFALITAPSVTFQPWNSTPIVEGTLGIRVNNIVIDGFEVRNNNTSQGIQVMGNNVTVKNNYVHGMGVGIISVGGMVPGFDANNVQIYNNILSNNEDIGSGFCGGILVGGTTDNIIINNTLYNNCSTFAFDGATNFLAGDIALFAAPGMGIAAPVNTLVKQNLVYNNLGGTGNTYYYDVAGELVNSVIAVGVITNQTAADHGTGNNFAETVTDPYVSAATVTDYASAGTGFGLTATQYATYQISSFDGQTPGTDYLGNSRPNGIGEAGAIEYGDPAGGGGYTPPTPPCSPLPTQLDIKDVYISQMGDNPAVTLRWVEAGLQINPDDKISALFSYLNQSLSPKIGANNIRLKNVFVRHIYDEFPGDLRQNFESVSEGVCRDQDDLADDMMKIIEELKDDPNAESLLLEFTDDLLNLENTLVKMGEIESSPFTDHYNEELGGGGTGGTLKVVRKIWKRGVYLADKTFDEYDDVDPVDPNATSWTNTNVAAGNYKYQLITKSCGETKEGNEATVTIDSKVPEGEEIDVSINLQIKVKEAYDTLMMNRFRDLFSKEEVDVSVYDKMCEDTKEDLFKNINSELALEYVITCFGENDEILIRAIINNKLSIIPPLVMKLKGLNGKATEDSVYNLIQSRIAKFREDLILMQDILTYIKSQKIYVGGFVNETNIADLTESEEEIMKQIDEEYEDYFKGFSHAAYLSIVKTDVNGNAETYTTRTDIFGGVNNVDLGKFTAGEDYTLKIMLADESFTLPKIANIQINNAVQVTDPGPLDANYSANVDLAFDRHFRVGNFDNTVVSEDVINIFDIIAWSKLLSGELPLNGYELWQLWEFANVDGTGGIDLSDILTMHENWGGLKEFTVEESQITLRELLQLFGIRITTQPELNTMVKVAEWLDWVGVDC